MTEPHSTLAWAEQPVSTYLKLVLIWIALADGTFSADEHASLKQMFPDDADKGELSFNELEGIVSGDDIGRLALACSVLRQALTEESRRLALQLAISIATVDGRLTVSENHILRFLADLLGCEPAQFATLYREITAADFPEPADLSSADLWTTRESAGRRRHSEDRGRAYDGSSNRRGEADSTSGRTRIRALAILGLEDGASAADIRAAYRRLAQIHHPDRFESLGPDAVNAAKARFAQIQRAHNYLRNP